MKVLAITQARVGSSRLPGKVTKLIGNGSILSVHLKRIQKAKLITGVKVATTNEDGVQEIIDICKSVGVQYHQGSLDDVLARFYYTAEPESPDYVVRLTSDCPLIDPEVIDSVIDVAITSDCDYVSNTLNPTFPDGIDVEVFKYSALVKAFNEAQLSSEREHVTPYIWKHSSEKGGNKFTSKSFEHDDDFSEVRLTVDTQEDFEVVSELVQLGGTDKTWQEYVNLLIENPKIQQINEKYKRNEGYDKSIQSEVNS